MYPTYASFVIRNKAEGYWGKFLHLFVSQASNKLAHLGELPWESKVKHVSLHFAWKETQVMLALFVASCSLWATFGAYELPSCSVNRPTCPGCITKPPGVHNKSRSRHSVENKFQPLESHAKWRRHRKKQHSPNQVSTAITSQGPEDLYKDIFKARGMMRSP